MWEYMKKEAPQKLLCGDRHELLLAGVGVVLPAKGDLTVGEVNNPVVGDCHTMCIASQVMKNVLRAAEGRFGVYDPVLNIKRPEKSPEHLRMS